MRRLHRVAPLIIAFGSALASRLDEALPPTKISYSVELLVVDGGGIHSIGGTGFSTLEFSDSKDGGSASLSVYLTKTTFLYCKLNYAAEVGAHAMITVERQMWEGAGRTARKTADLPNAQQDLDLLECWTTTLLEATKEHGRVVLRIAPVIQEDPVDKELEGEFDLWMNDSPVLDLGPPGAPDVVIFPNIYHRGPGLSIGIPGMGNVHVAPFRFPKAEPCGWVRGNKMEFELAGHRIAAWSTTPILPDDPRRPGKGWTLFGYCDKDPAITREKGMYYGSFMKDEAP
ncbi:MAG: hypothetical protein U0166_08860 [Acidobacteriota bacterium]